MTNRKVLPDTRDTRNRLFRALHGSDATTRKALVLLAQGQALDQVGKTLGVHPRFLRRRLEALGARLAS